MKYTKKRENARGYDGRGEEINGFSRKLNVALLQTRGSLIGQISTLQRQEQLGDRADERCVG